MSRADRQESDRKLALIQGILEGCFFSPLHLNEWLAFRFDSPGLLGLEEHEAFDLFVRAAAASRTLDPEGSQNGDPLEWVFSMPDSGPVLAHVLASLRFDRPFLFHRAILSLSAVTQGILDPEDYELVEDFLQAALKEPTGLAPAAADEWETLSNRAFKAAGQDPDSPDPSLGLAAEKVLVEARAQGIATDSQLLMWMAMGDGLSGLDDELAPGVMVETWRRFTGAVVGARPDLDLLAAFMPSISLSAEDLANHTMPGPGIQPVIKATCPFCSNLAAIRLLDEGVEKLSGCDHLVFVGTSDEVHLLEVLGNFELGEDFKSLISSYYQSPSDLELFATIINDLYEMLSHQGRLQAVPVSSDSGSEVFYNLSAYFTGPPPESSSCH